MPQNVLSRAAHNAHAHQAAERVADSKKRPREQLPVHQRPVVAVLTTSTSIQATHSKKLKKWVPPVAALKGTSSDAPLLRGLAVARDEQKPQPKRALLVQPVRASKTTDAAKLSEQQQPPLEKATLPIAPKVDATSTKPTSTTALEQARAKAKLKLGQALRAKKQALLERSSALVASRAPLPVLRPIQALLKGNQGKLMITSIQAGPAELVHFATTQLLSCDSSNSDASVSVNGPGSDMSESADESAADEIDNSKSSESMLSPKATTSAPNSVMSPLENIVLLKRKLELQTRIVEAKEKKQRLQKRRQEREEQENAVVAVPKDSIANLNREELESRRDIAERHRSITHFKHAISKTAHLFAEQQAKTRASEKNLQECDEALTQAQLEIHVADTNTVRIKARGKAVDQLMAETTSKLVEARQRLYEYKQRRKAVALP